MLSSHSIVSSSSTVRPCSPWGCQWIGHWMAIWSTVCSFAPHSQAAEEDILHLYKQERKRLTTVRRPLSRIRAVLGGFIPRRWVQVLGMKVRSLAGLSAHSAFHWWSGKCAARMLLSNKQMSCCGYKRVSRFEVPFICTLWTGERQARNQREGQSGNCTPRNF